MVINCDIHSPYIDGINYYTSTLFYDNNSYDTPSTVYFYTEVEISDKDILKIGNFIAEYKYKSDHFFGANPWNIYLILNREFLPDSKDMKTIILLEIFSVLTVNRILN